MSRKVATLTVLVAAAALLAHFGFFFYRDNFSTHYPLKHLSAKALRAGEIPYWNFHDSGGQPLAGNPSAQTFYPDAFLFVLFPAHVAFNLHFLIHLAAAFAAMRALCLARGLSARTALFAGTVYLFSGLVVSSTASYHSVVVVALVPFAFYAVERQSMRLLGVAGGLLGLAPEPAITVGLAIALAVLAAGQLRLRAILGAMVLAAVIASPQLIALAEIVGEVERVAGFSVRTMLNTSLTWTRVAEIFVWPLLGFLNEPGGGELRARFFSTIFLGPIAIPALFRRSRYVFIAGAMLFLALGRTNPIVAAAVEHLGALRVFRFPEKFVLILIPALVVLVAEYFEATRFRKAWAILTLAPLAGIAALALPIDWYAPYRVTPQQEARVHLRQTVAGGVLPAREEFRLRAQRLEPLFGAVAGLRYGLVRSPDRMHSLLSRIALERFDAGTPELRARYLRIAGCANVPGALPPAIVVTKVIGARTVHEAVRTVEDPRFDERVFAAAPPALHGFLSRGRLLRYEERGQTIEMDAEGPALLMVNQSFFSSWVARAGDRELDTVPLDIDRLGIVVPPGRHAIALRFGRYRLAVGVAWAASLLLLALAPLVEKLDRRTREVERPADEQ